MDTYRPYLDTLERHVKETKAAYYRNTPGVTYDDMAAAARRLLKMRASVERATGRPVTSTPTKAAIAAILRAC